ncbi:uncharacterized protein N7446_002243 [Penicillium canescens]|uniref:Uncharacterized protein n=1 Tax=Penicillium canescens TaxID=5083 RepID=A0AAD6IEC8_PENCN|nr:uncharacterized protein N7446_002243 [Penicillium canescens]KAJ6044046.1 hypothetical protein N7460_005401 [Penicillium canescens]KAJ6055518.1 hypothetical protein N7444_004616 [Penicillium canescens]KAJ6074466.1 hypothetical protein N7446_002243 [Penicillium canescens]
MPPLAGEERLLTVFADIHYYFTEPTRRPSPYHHRFDKGSYLYVYHDASQNKARIEIANNPGSPEQDAFCGELNHVHIRHSSQFPTLCTLTVDAHTNPSPQRAYSPALPQHEWRLPSGDPRDDPTDFRDFPRLHTLDIYFWGQEDATQFLDTAEQVLPSSQVETDREPAPQPEQPLSSVVQQLENVAVSDPAYQNGQTRNSRSDTQTTAPQPPQGPGIPQTTSFPPPPPSGPPADQNSSTGHSPAEEKKDPASFAPLPYNPAAPAAPEPIKHREKTPPPEDAMDGTGLAAAVAAVNGVPYTPPHQVIGGVGGVAGFASPPPSNSTPGLSYAGPPTTIIGPPGYASPPPSTGLQHTGSFSSHSSIQSPGLPVPSYSQSFLSGAGSQQWNASASPQRSGSMSFAPPPPQPQDANASPQRQGSMSFAPPPQDPNARLYDQHIYGGSQQPSIQEIQQQASTPVPMGGFSNYSYDKAPSQQPRQPGASEYDIHSQAYRPTEAEAGSHYQKYAQKAMKNPGQRPRKLEDKAERLESGVNRFFKKLEKRL